MRGRPVWLASISRRSRVTDRILATGLWEDRTRKESAALLRRLLGPAGDPRYERLFRMNVTMCLHRALAPDDLAQLPASFFEAEPIDLAGGPIEILEETEEGLETTKPCHDPERVSLDDTNPLLWFPVDCERCPPCLARLALGSARQLTREAVGRPPQGEGPHGREEHDDGEARPFPPAGIPIPAGLARR